MTYDTLREAIAEAERFVRIAKQITADDARYFPPGATVRTAAARRASMDLTRALARMRRTKP